MPLGYAFDTITVTPYTDSAIYYVNATNGTNNCFDSITIYVEQPSIVSQLLPSGCAGSDTLDVEATITANCYYTLQLLNSGSEPGWQVPTTSPQIYHNLDLNINASLFSNFTMLNGAPGSSIDFLIPVTDGDLLETYFTALGSASNECMFRIYDSQGIIANTGGGSTVTASTPFGATPLAHYYNNQLQFNIINGGSGYNSPPYSAMNPPPIVTITGGA